MCIGIVMKRMLHKDSNLNCFHCKHLTFEPGQKSCYNDVCSRFNRHTRLEDFCNAFEKVKEERGFD